MMTYEEFMWMIGLGILSGFIWARIENDVTGTFLGIPAVLRKFTRAIRWPICF